MTIKSRAWCAGIVLATIVLCGCGWQGELQKTRDEFAKQLEETRKVVLTATKDLTTSIPGGQYNLLIRDVNGDDPVAKTRAQAFLKALGHLENTDVPIEASVWFGFDASSPLKADIFRAPTLSRTEVEQRYAFKSGNLRTVGSKLSLPMSDQEIRSAINASVTNIGNILQSTPTPSGWKSLLFPAFQVATLFGQTQILNSDAISAAHNKAKGELVDNLRTAILAQYEQKLVPLISSDLQPVPWNVIDANQFLFVSIRQSDWVKHRKDGNLKVRAFIHEHDHPEKAFQNSAPMDFDLQEFDSSEPVDSYPSEGKVVWAVRNMTGRMLDSATLAELQTVKETFAKWEKELQKH